MENANTFGRFIYVTNRWVHLRPGVELDDAGQTFCKEIFSENAKIFKLPISM